VPTSELRDRFGTQQSLEVQPNRFLTNVPTGVGSHSMAYDETNRIVYVGDQRPGQAGLFSFPLPDR